MCIRRNQVCLLIISLQKNNFSPSLFHRPSTPQMSSTHFEWNIDEMSSLNPASFEAHETQFTSTTDPDVEAKAQAAISSFFREQVIGK